MIALRKLFAAWLAALMTVVPVSALSQGYQVQDGDTPCDLSVRFRMPVEALVQANAYEDMTQLFSVSRLWINRFAYRVRPKDNLADIAELAGTTVPDLLWMNRLQDEQFLRGAVVLIPSPPPQEATSPGRRWWRTTPYCLNRAKGGR